MTEPSPSAPFVALTLDAIEAYLRGRGLHTSRGEERGQALLRLDYTTDFGAAAVIVSVRDVPRNSRRLEITCVSEPRYRDRFAEALRHVNARNRALPLCRSVDPSDGRFILDYVGFYPRHADLPQITFRTLYDGMLAQFFDEYGLLERLASA